MGLAVELHGTIERELIVPAGASAQQQVAQPLAVERRVGVDRHPLVRQPQALGKAKPQQLRAAVAVEKAAVETEGDQVVVDDAVLTDIGAAVVDGRQVEIDQARVVERQGALVLVGGARIKQPGFEGLHQTAAEPGGFALEHQPAVQAEAGQHPVDAAAAIRQRRLHVVAGGVQLEFGCDETPGGNPGAADLGLRVAACAVACHGIRDAAVIGFETGGLPHHRPVQPAVVPLAIAQRQLWCAVIGWGDGRAHVLLGLPALHQAHHRQAVAAPGQSAGGRQHPLGQGHGGTCRARRTQVAARKVAPVQVVADPVDRERGAQSPHCLQTGVDAAVVLGHQAPAWLVAQLVLRQPVQAYLAVVVFFQVAELALQAQAALAHGAGHQGRVPVGRDVPVPGLHEVQTTDGVDRHHRCQQATGPVGFQRKPQIGQGR